MVLIGDYQRILKWAIGTHIQLLCLPMGCSYVVIQAATLKIGRAAMLKAIVEIT